MFSHKWLGPNKMCIVSCRVSSLVKPDCVDQELQAVWVLKWTNIKIIPCVILSQLLSFYIACY